MRISKYMTVYTCIIHFDQFSKIAKMHACTHTHTCTHAHTGTYTHTFLYGIGSYSLWPCRWSIWRDQILSGLSTHCLTHLEVLRFSHHFLIVNSLSNPDLEIIWFSHRFLIVNSLSNPDLEVIRFSRHFLGVVHEVLLVERLAVLGARSHVDVEGALLLAFIVRHRHLNRNNNNL
jgi:hypothetical protein